MAVISLTVNNRAHQLDLDPETPLLWVLRDHLNLVGTKFGCGGSFCGACTVHLDGVATRSCSTPVGKIGSRRVTTIEGLSANGDHPAQRAWEEIDVPQCGYCQAGQIMTCAALLARKAQSVRRRHDSGDERQHLPVRAPTCASRKPCGQPQTGKTTIDGKR